MKRRIYYLVLVGILGMFTFGNATTPHYLMLSIEQVELAIQQDTIQPKVIDTSIEKIKEPKKSWLPKIRLRVLVVLFREKLKERDRRKRKSVYPIVDGEQNKTRTVRAK